MYFPDILRHSGGCLADNFQKPSQREVQNTVFRYVFMGFILNKRARLLSVIPHL